MTTPTLRRKQTNELSSDEACVREKATVTTDL